MTIPLPTPPLLAQLGLIRRATIDLIPVLDELNEEFGPMVQMGFGPLRVAIIGDPGALNELFSTSVDHFRWGHKFNVLGFVVGDESLLVSDGADHKRRRAPTQAAFALRRLQSWLPMMLEQTDHQIDQLLAELGGGSRSVDLYPVGRSIVLHIVVRALFGEELAGRADEIGHLFQRPQDYLESSAIRQIPHRLPFTRRARVRADRRALEVIVADEIARRRLLDRVDDETAATDGLGMLLAAGTLSDDEIIDQVLSLIGAGYDTTAASLAWMIWTATTTPGLWEELRAEADAGFPSDGSAFDADGLARLELANRTMRETLRLYPAGAIAPREAAEDVDIAGYRIRRGTLILWSAYLAGRSDQAWPDPMRFDPDRFNDLTDEQQAVADQAWVPFGRGARTCVGFALAQMELTLIISRLAQRLDVVSPSDGVPRPVGMVVNRPKGGAPMKVSTRSFS